MFLGFLIFGIINALCWGFVCFIACKAREEARAALRALHVREPQDTREERIARLRGVILQATAADLHLRGNNEMPAPIILANAHMAAAQAREQLRALGVEA